MLKYQEEKSGSVSISERSMFASGQKYRAEMKKFLKDSLDQAKADNQTLFDWILVHLPNETHRNRPSIYWQLFHAELVSRSADITAEEIMKNLKSYFEDYPSPKNETIEFLEKFPL